MADGVRFRATLQSTPLGGACVELPEDAVERLRAGG
jgi:hypothetical protein